MSFISGLVFCFHSSPDFSQCLLHKSMKYISGHMVQFEVQEIWSPYLWVNTLTPGHELVALKNTEELTL